MNRIGYDSPNNLALTALSVVWTWLKPELPKPLKYTECTTLTALVASIRKKDEQYTERITNKFEWMHHYDYQIVLMEVSDRALNYKTLEFFEKEKRSCDFQVRSLTNKQALLETNTFLIVNTVAALQTCCYGATGVLLN